MTFKGNLSEISAPDVMHYLHVCRRTGTLRLRAGALGAALGFEKGDIVWATGPGTRPLGDLLIEAGALEERTLVAALAVQVAERPRRPLAEVLLQSGAVRPDDLLACVRREIERVVHGLVFWAEGTFAFELTMDRSEPVEGPSLPAGALGPKHRIDTQAVLLEAARLHDDLARARRDQGS